MLQRPEKNESAICVIRASIDNAAHHLPEQAPLQAFVHHNTLHAFEEYPFERAVVEAANLYGTEPFQTEAAFFSHIRSGRLKKHDITEVLGAESTRFDRGALFPGGPTRFEYKLHRLLNEIPEIHAAALPWYLAESSLLFELFDPAQAQIDGYPITTSDLPVLWKLLEAEAPVTDCSDTSIRMRDLLFQTIGQDTDTLVHPLLIRFTAAFFDQGISYWRFPLREKGYLASFLELYALPFSGAMDWQRGLNSFVAEVLTSGLSSLEIIQLILDELGVEADRYEQYILQTLLSLRGWAGMVRMIEVRPDTLPVTVPPITLCEYLAVQLMLELHAGKAVIKSKYGSTESLVSVRNRLLCIQSQIPVTHKTDLKLVYEAFIMAQVLGIGFSVLMQSGAARCLVEQGVLFNSYERRRVLHFAYERRHRTEVLDGLYAQVKMCQTGIAKPVFQAVFCIDDREESLRRHLEEVCPACETFGYVGFYGVAMSYTGLDDVKPQSLCPVGIRPQHQIREVSDAGGAVQRYQSRKQRIGLEHFAAHVGSNSLIRGAFLTEVLGYLYMIPLILRTLFPRIAGILQDHMTRMVLKTPETRLLLERAEGTPAKNGLYPGYTVSEMVPIVENALRTQGLTSTFSKLIFIIGHGSSSVNNPHCAAYGCGATGGGKGGPNARAFAMMANNPRVRSALRLRGIYIPEQTYFIGAYHNTCDDSLQYYDEGSIPAALQTDFKSAQQIFERALVLDAHERCRKFESAPVSIKPAAALKHVQTRAKDLAQPRPECGHATNSMCIIGRRDLTRGLFLDRRAFLVSYSPSSDAGGEILAALLRSVSPVCAGINLEYYFSYIDPERYGCGSKLPHNVTGLFGVMDGHCSDLRTGLPWQMVELHEPVRLLIIVEAEIRVLSAVLQREKTLQRLVRNGWIQLVALSPSSSELFEYKKNHFVHYIPEQPGIPICKSSQAFYRQKRDCLPCAHVEMDLVKE